MIKLAYNGAAYYGWQKQPDAVTVQGVLEEKLSLLLRQRVLLTGAGRTDAGVHARQMFAHFEMDDQARLKNLVYRINQILPNDISVFDVFPSDLHARFDAKARSYEYHFHLRADPFYNKTSYVLHRQPDFQLMDQAAQILLDYRDFECFSRSKTDVKTYLCDITEARFEKIDEWHVVFHITADRFLRNMVRAIVGTLLDIGYGKKTIDDLHQIIQSKKRGKAGASAPAHGLFLSRITY
jgi:tRNA pseudouridine38-40 synthase